ncbi:MAG TPA: RnfABCDGE type electron transport complex subunit D [Vicinamibacterales bacterium]|nr:RnfABCDGE type electron transport complex subunit D [Vicinamibacterales bacterium]
MIHTLFIPFAFAAGLLALTALPRLQTTPILTWSFWGAGAVLILWNLWLVFRFSGKSGRRLVAVTPRPQHYIQTFCHSCVYAYWGYYWPPVYDFFPLLAGQLLFAYAFDMLLAWSRGEDYQFGWGPFPIVFSTNLFLWFKDDVFYWQFVLIALGFAGKAFVRWNRDGKRVHIFNPSAFTLAIFSVVLLATGTTSLTWGQEIATTFSLGPRIYVVLFLIGLVVMYFFSITLVTAAAAATLVGLSALYVSVTGVPYFVDSDIPSAVFLGMHLLVTDPSTSPRTPFGRLIFGILYGLGVFGLYALLGAMGVPTFYDKLLCVPLLNLMVPAIDRFVKSFGQRPLLHALRLDGPLGRGNLAHMAVWGAFFALMSTTGSADGMHRGDSLPFWIGACADNKPQACERLLRIEGSYCSDNAGWACNELGVHYLEGRIIERDPERAFRYFARACEGRFQAGCVNLLEASPPARTDPRTLDLRLLLRQGGPNLLEMPEPELYQRACRHGWSFACQRVGK